MSVRDIPIFITYRDRATMLTRCITSLLQRGVLPQQITVVDNDSAIFPPIQDRRINIHHTDNTYRHLAPWGEGLVPRDDPYIVMDCDIELDCPSDFLEHLLQLLETNPSVNKIGLGIRTDDFLDPPPARYDYSYRMEYAVRMRFKEIAPGLIDAPVDTHFALYRAGNVANAGGGITGARTTAPYLCRHLPWYNEEYSEEEKVYYQRTGNQWAREHSAQSLVPLNVVVGFTKLRAETVISLRDAGVGDTLRVRPLINDTAYFELLSQQWTEGDTFMTVEQNIEVTKDAMELISHCESDWCAAPYNYLGQKHYGLGCTKFSYKLIARHPDLFAEVAKFTDDQHPPKHWCRLDMWIYEILAIRGEVRCEHETWVRHLDNDHTAHGCLV